MNMSYPRSIISLRYILKANLLWILLGSLRIEPKLRATLYLYLEPLEDFLRFFLSPVYDVGLTGKDRTKFQEISKIR